MYLLPVINSPEPTDTRYATTINRENLIVITFTKVKSASISIFVHSCTFIYCRYILSASLLMLYLFCVVSIKNANTSLISNKAKLREIIFLNEISFSQFFKQSSHPVLTALRALTV